MLRNSARRHLCIEGLTTGEYTVTATSFSTGSQNRAGYASVQIAGRNLTTTIHLGEAASVQGRVIGKGTRLSAYNDLKVTVEPISEEGLYVSGIDAGGYFNVENIPPGIHCWTGEVERRRRTAVSRGFLRGQGLHCQSLLFNNRQCLNSL